MIDHASPCTAWAYRRGRPQWLVSAGYLAPSVMPLYFGLATATQADSITVKWPTGTQQVVPVPLRSGATVVVREQ